MHPDPAGVLLSHVPQIHLPLPSGGFVQQQPQMTPGMFHSSQPLGLPPKEPYPVNRGSESSPNPPLPPSPPPGPPPELPSEQLPPVSIVDSTRLPWASDDVRALNASMAQPLTGDAVAGSGSTAEEEDPPQPALPEAANAEAEVAAEAAAAAAAAARVGLVAGGGIVSPRLTRGLSAPSAQSPAKFRCVPHLQLLFISASTSG